MKVRIAVTPSGAALGEEQFGAYLQACEALGFDTIWLSDVPLGPLGDPLLSLAYAAARTTKLKLGMNMVPLGRNPLWLSKQLAQLDRLSSGRLLLSFVPGLGQPTERAALGYATADRGKDVDRVIDLARAWWRGETVTASFGPWQYDEVQISPMPIQDPLEIWLGGIGPIALDRVARLADGWLTASATPAEAAAGRRTIEARAASIGRVIDGDHFGISLPYARSEPADAVTAALRKRRADGDLSGILPVGGEALTHMLRAHIDGGLTKFVLRPIATITGEDWRDELSWLADHVLPLQT
jgi:probable F420-dependent oxidoreductase